MRGSYENTALVEFGLTTCVNLTIGVNSLTLVHNQHHVPDCHSPLYYASPYTVGGGIKQRCDLSVRLSAHIPRKTHKQTLSIFFMLSVTVTRSSSDGVAIRYVLPVLWMMSRFHTTAARHITSIPTQAATEDDKRNGRDSRPNFPQRQSHRKCRLRTPGAKSARYDCLDRYASPRVRRRANEERSDRSKTDGE